MTAHVFAPRFDLNDALFPPSNDVLQPSFVMQRRGPPIKSEDVEADLAAIEITVRWDQQILQVAHLKSGESFFLGEGAEIALPAEVLGMARMPIVHFAPKGAYVTVPKGAAFELTTRGETRRVIEIPEALEIDLDAETSVRVEFAIAASTCASEHSITVNIETVRAGKVFPAHFLSTVRDGAIGFVGLSFLGHSCIVALMALFMPALAADDTEAVDRDQVLLMQKFLDASAERENEHPPENAASEAAEAGGGSTGVAHRDAEGVSGTTRPVTTHGRMAVQGSEARSQLSPKAMSEAATFGMVGLLAAEKADLNAPTSRWATAAVGSDAASKWGDLFSPQIGDTAGTGLGLSGTGEGGGGPGEGVGFDGINTVGGGGGGTGKYGIGPRDKGGMGTGHSPLGGGHIVKFKVDASPDIHTNGRLPAEVIQRIVRQNFGRFRLCYEGGLRGNPSLSGRVSTKFVIGRDGAVSHASDAGSDLPDRHVVECVVRSFHALSFPAPEGGIATVTYPILLNPGDGF